MINIIRSLLVSIIDRIDSGNSNLDDKECEEVIEYLTFISNRGEKLSIYQACEYLDMTRAEFDWKVKTGVLPKGRKQSGFKELFYYKCDLEKYRNADKKDKGV